MLSTLKGRTRHLLSAVSLPCCDAAYSRDLGWAQLRDLTLQLQVAKPAPGCVLLIGRSARGSVMSAGRAQWWPSSTGPSAYHTDRGDDKSLGKAGLGPTRASASQCGKKSRRGRPGTPRHRLPLTRNFWQTSSDGIAEPFPNISTTLAVSAARRLSPVAPISEK